LFRGLVFVQDRLAAAARYNPFVPCDVRIRKAAVIKSSTGSRVGLRPCHGLFNTPGNSAEIKIGIALDPSAGEQFDYANEPESSSQNGSNWFY
jgi:hypothetical protein